MGSDRKTMGCPILSELQVPLIYQPISLRIHPRPQTFDWVSARMLTISLVICIGAL